VTAFCGHLRQEILIHPQSHHPAKTSISGRDVSNSKEYHDTNSEGDYDTNSNSYVDSNSDSNSDSIDMSSSSSDDVSSPNSNDMSSSSSTDASSSDSNDMSSSSSNDVSSSNSNSNSVDTSDVSGNTETETEHENTYNPDEEIFTTKFFDQDFLATVVATCNFPPEEGEISGSVTFTQVNGGMVLIDVNVTGLPPNTAHGFHLHEFGDISNGCSNVGGHFNPFNDTHGGPEDFHRELGDLGNISADEDGDAIGQFKDRELQLSGPLSGIGRAIVIHQNKDDFGRGSFNDSKTLGHSGAKIACCVVGFKNMEL